MGYYMNLYRKTFLIFLITGSSKVSCYLQIFEDTLKIQKLVIMQTSCMGIIYLSFKKNDEINNPMKGQ